MLKSNGSFCNDLSSFNNLLKVNSKIQIENDNIIFNTKKFDYSNITNNVKDRNQHYFKLSICSNNDKDISDLLELLKTIREVIYKADAHINVLWDDISNFYSIQAYPEINKIENLLRKLITTFMLINLGMDWSKEATPNEIKTPNQRGSTKENSNVNFLHDTDFIQLADFLFKAYPTKDINILFKEFKKAKKIEDLDLPTLQEFVPRSNWDRYFKSYVDCEDEYLNKNWAKLYELRCKVAHNSFLSKTDFEEIIKLTKELEEKFLKAIDNIDAIIVPPSEQSSVIENVIISQNEKLEEFFKFWNMTVNAVEKLYVRKCKSLEKQYRVRDLVNELNSKEVLSDAFNEQITSIGIFYNKITEKPEKITSEEVHEMTEKIKDFYLWEVWVNTTFEDEEDDAKKEDNDNAVK